MTTLSAHVLDTGTGRPAAGLSVTLSAPDRSPLVVATDADGRVAFEGSTGPGEHVLALATGAWFAEQGRDTLFPRIELAFTVDAEQPHYHLAVLLGPFSYTAYRGS
ncbi:hydroxyisourate hydrolase [Nocardioides ultimimeridianus]